jgi:DNA primase
LQQDPRDSLALEIYMNKALHRPFMRMVGAAMNYGFNVIERQAKHALYREDFEQNLPFLKVQASIYRHFNVDVTVPEFWKTEEFYMRGKAAMEITAGYLHEKTQNLPKMTLLYLREQKIDCPEVRQEAFEYNRFVFAKNLKDPQEQRHAELVAAYGALNRQASDIYRRCMEETRAYNSEIRIEENKLTVRQAKGYRKYVEITGLANRIAFELSSYDKDTTQALANLFGINTDKLEGHRHMGELQNLIHEFKSGKTITDKSHAASELVAWLGMDKEYRTELKELTGQFSPTYHLLQREKVNWPELFTAASYHKVTVMTGELTTSQQELWNHVLAYSTARAEVGKSYAAVMEEFNKEDKGAEKPKIYRMQAWPQFMASKEIMNSHAHVLHKASKEDIEPFREIFNLREDRLRQQSLRHEMVTAIKSVLSEEAGLTERAAFYLQIQSWSGAKEEGISKDITGLMLHYATPSKVNKIGDSCLARLKAESPEDYRQVSSQHQCVNGERKIPKQNILEQVERINTTKYTSYALDHNIERLEKVQAEYHKALKTAGTSFEVFKNQQISIRDIESELKDKIVPLALDLFAGEKLHTRNQKQLRFGSKGSRSIIVSGNKQGVYADFETGVKGNVFTMIQDRLGVSFKEALDWSQEWLGNPTRQQQWESFKATQKDHYKAVEESRFVSLYPAPKEPVDIANNKYLNYALGEGKETMRFAYHDADKNLLGYVVRIEQKDGSKVTLPLTYCRDLKTDKSYWKWRGFGKDAPLYGLDQLADKPKAPVLVVEGEKAADAARERFRDYAVVTWPGGASAVTQANWEVLKGRDVIIWPDNDKAGFKAADKVKEACIENKAHSVGIVSLPESLPGKWDLADTCPENLNPEDIRNLMDKTLQSTQAQAQHQAKVTPQINALFQYNDLNMTSKESRDQIKIQVTERHYGLLNLCQSIGVELSDADKAILLKTCFYIETKAQEIRLESRDISAIQTHVQADRQAVIHSLYLKKDIELTLEEKFMSPTAYGKFDTGFDKAVTQIESMLGKKNPDMDPSCRHGVAVDVVKVINICPKLEEHLNKVIEHQLAHAEQHLSGIDQTITKITGASPNPERQATADLVIQKMYQNDRPEQSEQRINRVISTDRQLQIQHDRMMQLNRQGQLSI